MAHRICLIVDNPDRDLDGMVLLASTLARRGAEVFLVPMYNQRLEVNALQPDFVLMNYARLANRALMRDYARHGIAIGVLDTEGGIWESELMYVQSANKEGMEAHVELYCLWGDRQRRAFLSYTNYPSSKFVVTGHPRYDFYAEPWVRCIPPARVSHGRAQVLLISNFVLAYPRYARNSKIEMQNMMESGFDQETLDQRLDADRQSRRELVAAVDKLATEFPDVDWVLRPHPFEDDSEYQERFAGSRNIFVRGDLTVAPWIRGSAMVIHANSSVAVDAYLLGVYQVCIDWIENPILRKWADLVTWKVSRKAADFGQLRQLVRELLNSPNSTPPAVDTAAAREIEDWFHRNDGQAGVRVAEAILRLLAGRRPKPVQAAFAPRAVRDCVELAAGVALGTRNYGFIRSVARSFVVNRKLVLNRAALKDLDVARVRSKLRDLDLLQDLQPCSALSAGRLREGGIVRRRLAQNSIRIAMNEAGPD